jgi:hypothetical protein
MMMGSEQQILTNSTEQSPSREADSRSFSNEIPPPPPLCNWNADYHVHKN